MVVSGFVGDGLMVVSRSVGDGVCVWVVVMGFDG